MLKYNYFKLLPGVYIYQAYFFNSISRKIIELILLLYMIYTIKKNLKLVFNLKCQYIEKWESSKTVANNTENISKNQSKNVHIANFFRLLCADKNKTGRPTFCLNTKTLNQRDKPTFMYSTFDAY